MADGRRSLRELSKRRHAILALPRSTTIERKRRKVDPEEVVGWLARTDGAHEIRVALGSHIWIGRAKDCDVRLNSPEMSAYHLRLYATELIPSIRTSTSQSLVCVQDASINGFTLNDVLHKPEQTIHVGSVQLSNRQAILREGDTLLLPGCNEGYVYHHAKRHNFSSQAPQTQGVVECRSEPLFPSTDPSLTHPLPPWTVHNFPLGHGTFGMVHLATAADHPAVQVACKTLDVRYLDQNRFVLQNEVEILKRAAHPNLCGILDVLAGPEGRHSHLILPLVVGGDLFTYFEKHGALSELEVQFMAMQLLEAVEFLHVRQIAHRDIKLENIFLRTSSAYPHILLGDFGLATTYKQVLATVPDSRVQNTTREYTLDGTASYMPPEHLRSILGRTRGMSGLGESIHGGVKKWREEVGRQWFEQELAWDKWALGVVLYTIMAGMHPYDSGDDPDADGEEVEVAPMTPYRRLASTKSWEAFRKEKGEGALGQTNANRDPRSEEWEKMLRAAETFSRHRNVAARVGMGQDVSRVPVQRPGLTKAKSHEWMRGNKAELTELYRVVVRKGQLACGRGAKPLVVRASSQSEEMPEAAGSGGMDIGIDFDLPTPTPAPRRGKDKGSSKDNRKAQGKGGGGDTGTNMGGMGKGSKSTVRPLLDGPDAFDDMDVDQDRTAMTVVDRVPDSIDETDPPRLGSSKKSRRKVLEAESSSTPPPPRPIHRQTASMFLPDSGIFSQPLGAIVEAEEQGELEEEEEEEERPTTLAAAMQDVDLGADMETMDVELGYGGLGMDVDKDASDGADLFGNKHLKTPARADMQVSRVSKDVSSKSTVKTARKVTLAPSPVKKTLQATSHAQLGSSSKSPIIHTDTTSKSKSASKNPAPIAIKSRGRTKVTVMPARGAGAAAVAGAREDGLFVSAGGGRK